MSTSTSKGRYVGAIDQGTTSSRFILFDRNGNPVISHQVKLPNIFPKPGWQEQDPKEILSTVETCISKVMEKVPKEDVAAVGVTNQRETLVCWDVETGEPLHNAIVWCDARTAEMCAEWEKRFGGKDAFRDVCGLPISTYFSATKLAWLLENSDAVRAAAQSNRLRVGTVDSWLIYRLTGGAKGGVHVTDVSNASRTMLMSLKTRDWDPSVCASLGISVTWLPRIKSSSEVYKSIHDGPLKGCAISGCIGDQQGALLGQLCIHKGNAKNTYGTGCFLLMNTGDTPVFSTHGLLTTAAYQLGPDAPCHYALEGSVAVAGAALSWLQDSLNIVNSPKEFDQLAASVPDNGGVYFVPAFSGLLSPHWKDSARGVIVGLTRFATRAHLCRATLEASAFQTNDVIQAMEKDAGMRISSLAVDGGLTRSDILCQFQADILQVPVDRPHMDERTALGAAVAAGLAKEVGFWRDLSDVVSSTSAAGTKGKTEDGAHKASPRPGFVRFDPSSDQTRRQELLRNWEKAIQRSFDWVESDAKASKL